MSSTARRALRVAHRRTVLLAPAIAAVAGASGSVAGVAGANSTNTAPDKAVLAPRRHIDSTWRWVLIAGRAVSTRLAPDNAVLAPRWHAVGTGGC